MQRDNPPTWLWASWRTRRLVGSAGTFGYPERLAEVPLGDGHPTLARAWSTPRPPRSAVDVSGCYPPMHPARSSKRHTSSSGAGANGWQRAHTSSLRPRSRAEALPPGQAGGLAARGMYSVSLGARARTLTQAPCNLTHLRPAACPYPTAAGSKVKSTGGCSMRRSPRSIERADR